MSIQFQSLIQQYKSDKESVYNTWFINNEELMNNSENHKPQLCITRLKQPCQ